MSTGTDAKNFIIQYMTQNPGVALTHWDMGTILRLNKIFYDGALTPDQRKDDSNSEGYEVWERGPRKLFCHSSAAVIRNLSDHDIYPALNGTAWVYIKPYSSLVKPILRQFVDMTKCASGEQLTNIKHSIEILEERYK